VSSEILINVRPSEVRVAYQKNSTVCELKVERKTSPTMVGSIAIGKVTRVLPGMQAAFVDIGLERAAFLYVGDVRPNVHSNESLLQKADEDEPVSETDIAEQVEKDASRSDEERPKIEDILTEGQKILVQVAKDPIGTKGARLTTHISLPGRSVVFMPNFYHVG
jgi:ribonuclease G